MATRVTRRSATTGWWPAAVAMVLAEGVVWASWRVDVALIVTAVQLAFLVLGVAVAGYGGDRSEEGDEGERPTRGVPSPTAGAASSATHGTSATGERRL